MYKLAVLVLCFFLGSPLFGQDSYGEPQVLDRDYPLFNLTVDGLDKGTWLVTLVFDIPQGLHQTLQEEWFGFDVLGAVAGPTSYPPSDYLIDGFPSYGGLVSLSREVQGPGPGQAITVVPRWQLCFDSGVCLRPEDLKISVVLPQEGETVSLSVDPRATPDPDLVQVPTVTQPALLVMMLFAFLGGLILNVMPCVLPVLSLKVYSLAKNKDLSQSQRSLQALSGGAGIVVSLLILGGIAALISSLGQSVGWGFQFQTPWYGFILSLILLVFALSLFDVWTLPSPRLVVGVNGSNRGIAPSSLVKSFGDGVLMVVLATPCSAPFLGPAAGFAFASPWYVMILIFLSIGLGLALPYVLLGTIPSLATMIPKPGPWLEVMKTIMGFSLLATVVWLVTVLMAQLSLPSLSSVLWILLVLAIGLWFFGRVQRSGLGGLRRYLSLGAVLALVLLTSLVLLGPRGLEAPSGGNEKLLDGWETFDEAAFQEAVTAGEPVFVAFSATWCLTCQVNEAGVLASKDFITAYDSRGVRRFYGDYTNPNPVITDFLHRYGRAAVPFYLYVHGTRVEVLPEILTLPMVLGVLDDK